MRIRDDILLGQHSHVGMARTANEDFFGYWESDDDRQFDLKGRLVVVCDGMGGHAGGEIASRLAVKTIIEAYEASTSEDPMEALRAAIEKANDTVYKESAKPNNAKLKGMGSTMTCLVQRRELVYFGQVGDSRCYLVRGGAIQQMTKDHSLVQQLVDEGLLDKSEMENHPDKNVILRSLGVKPQVDVDVSYVPGAVGDVYLLCSDGLSGLVSEKEMLGIVQAGLKSGGDKPDLRKMCEQLVDLANRYGGHDNITVQLLMIRSTKPLTDTAPKETVTSQFTPDEVAASIAAARAQAAAKGGGKPPATVETPVAAPPPAGAMPMTQPSMPVPQLEAAPAAAKGGGGGVKLFLGLLVGLLLGAGVLFGVVKAGLLGGGGGRAAAEQAQKDATAEQAKAKAGPVKDSGLRLMGEGQKAFDAGQYDEARHKWEAAKAVFGGAQ